MATAATISETTRDTEALVERPEIKLRYLSGAPHPPVLRWRHGGLMFTPSMRNRTLPLGEIAWAADNGCFTAGARFKDTRWLDFLDQWRDYAGSCLFAVLPDVPFDHAATVTRSLPYIERVRALGYIPALAIQEGARPENIPWESGIGALFIAGGKPKLTPVPLWSEIAVEPPVPQRATRAFKTSDIVKAICREGKRRGFHLHSARNNSYSAVQAAYDMGCDTVDGTFLAYAPDVNFRRMQRWISRLCTHEWQVTWGADTRYGYCVRCRRQVCSSLDLGLSGDPVGAVSDSNVS